MMRGGSDPSKEAASNTVEASSMPIATNDFLFFKPRNSNHPVKSTLNNRHLKTIITAIHACWYEIETFPYQKSQPFQTHHLFDEDELSTKLVEILNYKLQRNSVAGFRGTQFQDVVRDSKQSTSKADSHDQMPDIAFHMVAYSPNEDRSESGLFVECKLISKNSGCGKYVSAGMCRFVSGRYASQMGYGLMLGYATVDFHDPAVALNDYFKIVRKTESVQCKAKLEVTTLHHSCYASIHKRANPCAPQFCTFHIWLLRRGVS